MFSIAGALNSIPYVLATVALLFVYNDWVDNPMVAREARQGYVQEARVSALEESNTELKRQARESEQLAQSWQKALEGYQTVSQDRERELEERIAQYAADPANVDRHTLTDADVNFLRGGRP